MDIAKDPVEDDTTIEKDDFKLFLERKAHDILFNTTIDFMEGHGFVITGAKDSCGSCSC